MIRLNKEADAAQTVRRQFLHQCLDAKPRHKAMTGWALDRIVNRDRTYSSWTAEPWRTGPVLGEILGGDPAALTAAAPPSRHPVIVWAHVAAAYEEQFPRDAHREVDPHRAAYLTHLVALGYTLADVEQRIIDKTKLDQDRSEEPADGVVRTA